MSKEKRILEIINKAIAAFNQNEQYLIKYDLSERCICARFAHYLELELNKTIYEDYQVDVEYNRMVDAINTIKRLEPKNIVVDLIVHKRGTNDNLICLEMKKCQRDTESDKIRLKYLTSNQYRYMYKIGFLLLIQRNIKKNIYQLSIDKIMKNGSTLEM